MTACFYIRLTRWKKLLLPKRQLILLFPQNAIIPVFCQHFLGKRSRSPVYEYNGRVFSIRGERERRWGRYWQNRDGYGSSTNLTAGKFPPESLQRNIRSKYYLLMPPSATSPSATPLPFCHPPSSPTSG